MIVSREALLNALESISPSLSTRDQLDQGKSFVFKEGYIYTYNDETACRCKSPLDIEGAIEAGPMLEVLHKIKRESLTAEVVKEDILRFSDKKDTIRLRMNKDITLPIENLDVPTKKSAWKDLPTAFSEAIEFVEDCASKNDKIKPLACIHLTQKYVEAFDNFQLSRYRLKLPLAQEDLLVKQVALRHVAKMVMIEFCDTDNWIHFRDAKKQVFSCRVYLQDYYDLDEYIRGAKGKKIKLPAGLVDAADKGSVFSAGGPHPEDNNIIITFKHNRVYVEAAAQFGDYDGWRKLEYTGPEFRFKVNPKILIELVKKHPECELGKNTLKAESGRATFVSSLVPVDPKAKKKKGKKHGKTRP